MHVMAAIYNWLGLYIHWHHCWIDCNQLGLCIDGCILSNRLQSARIEYQWMLKVALTIGLPVGLTVGSMVDSTVSSKVGLTVDLAVGLTWLCWTIDLSKSFDSSDKRIMNLLFYKLILPALLNELVVLRALTALLNKLIVSRVFKG